MCFRFLFLRVTSRHLSECVFVPLLNTSRFFNLCFYTGCRVLLTKINLMAPEHSETMKNDRQKSETPMKSQETTVALNKIPISIKFSNFQSLPNLWMAIVINFLCATFVTMVDFDVSGENMRIKITSLPFSMHRVQGKWLYFEKCWEASDSVSENVDSWKANKV